MRSRILFADRRFDIVCVLLVLQTITGKIEFSMFISVDFQLMRRIGVQWSRAIVGIGSWLRCISTTSNDDKSAMPRVRFAVDRGGTFTDVVALVTRSLGSPPEIRTAKLLSQSAAYDDAPSEGIRRMLVELDLPSETKKGLIDTSHIDSIRMGTTIATNALLEHKGTPHALLVTEGFQHILDIGTQARPHLFTLNIRKPKKLPVRVIEVDERVRLVTPKEISEASPKDFSKWRRGLSQQWVHVVRPLNAEKWRKTLKELYSQGIRSLAVSLMHAFTYVDHEQQIAEIAKRVGFTNVSLSHELMPMIKFLPRTTTTSVDAYLTPMLIEYVQRFKAKFAGLNDNNLLFIQSDGGLTPAEKFRGFRAVLSGPAGGVVGFSETTKADLNDVPMIGLDMGGTSTDVSRVHGSLTHVVTAEIAGTLLQAPQLDVRTVAAGGGSILFWRNGMFATGPESAGALPGPACYGRGGPATITDANVVLGRVQPKYFPKLFGKNHNSPLDLGAARRAFEKIQTQIEADLKRRISLEELASSFVATANEEMARPIRTLTEAQGYRPADHILTVFGGAGGQHAYEIARGLGISRVLIPQHAGVLSAVGISFAEEVEEAQRPCQLDAGDTVKDCAAARAVAEELAREVESNLLSRSFERDQIETSGFANVRYKKTSTQLVVRIPRKPDGAWDFDALKAAFLADYEREFGFTLSDVVIVDDIRVRAEGRRRWCISTAEGESDAYLHRKLPTPTERDTVRVYFGKWMDVPLYDFSVDNGPIRGPAIIALKGCTVVVHPNSTAYTSSNGSIVMHCAPRQDLRLSTKCDPKWLSIFANRFMSIAEQMGVALQRTSISTNIKERLDFSCGLFDNCGNLVANAPHIPVHLGAMGRAVDYQRQLLGKKWKEGEVVVTNDPMHGGSHLPDITVITPCFIGGNITFFIASRGHHADIGGSTPGSMPPFAKSLHEEGALIESFKLVKDGKFQEEGIINLLMEPAKYPGLHGCLQIEDVVSDLKAQVAANHRGVELVAQLVKTYGSDVIKAYMKHIQDAAEQTTRKMLRGVAAKYGTHVSARDFMDDGTPIEVHVEINPKDGSAIFDWSKTGPQVFSGTNCPNSVVRSATMYCLRCLVDSDIPLNEGCLKPVVIKTVPNTILDPAKGLAVAGGNVLTSQRVTDVILTSFHAVACSQGDMNNFTFGNDQFAYYETICGGSGAGPNFDGASAVHTHMTNTRITDPEIFESRYPAIIRQFSIRAGSGGSGTHRGGDGVIRSVLFLEDVDVSLLCERRALAPKGLHGGGDGAKGSNLLYRANISTSLSNMDRVKKALERLADSEQSVPINVGAKNKFTALIGDTVEISTPGGGGYGEKGSNGDDGDSAVFIAEARENPKARKNLLSRIFQRIAPKLTGRRASSPKRKPKREPKRKSTRKLRSNRKSKNK